VKDVQAPSAADLHAANTDALVWGLGSGRNVRALLRDGHRVEVLAIDVDRPEIARAIIDGCARLVDAEREGRLRVMVAPPEQLAAHFSLCRADTMHVDLAALAGVPEPARDLARMIERLWNERADLHRFAPRLRANLRSNLEAITSATSLARWRDAALGRPGFVLAAGPSARAALPWLAEARRVGPLIAVDTCLPLLRTHEVPIDCLVSVDPHPESSVHLREGTGGVGVLAMQPYCTPEIVAAFPRRVLAMPAGDRLCDRAAAELDLPALPVAGTVLLYALQIAELLGCNPIVIAGADFAHVDGLSHAHGTATARSVASTGLVVSDRRGRPVPTSTSLLRFKGDVEQHIAASSARHIVVDGGGAAIAGVRTVEPAAIARWVRRRSQPFTLDAPPRPDELQIARHARVLRRVLAEFDVG
jgi:6-hydroxymethylpterin diphosphokinase MptE-like protein